MNFFSSLETAALEAFSRSFAIIEFQPDGTVITANDNFCKALGYAPEDISGKHHRMFCDPGFVKGMTTSAFGTISLRAMLMLENLGGLAKMVEPFGFRLHIALW